jgi:glycosyltransferase involved in cell wall biosynthesis
VTPHVVHVASGREWRGGERQVWLLARELAHQNDLTQIVVTARGGELADRIRAAGLPVCEVPWKAGVDPRAFPVLVREARRPGALLHAHDAHAVTLAGITARLTSRPYVATRRVDFPLRRPGFWAGAHRVIAISQAVARMLAADGIDPARIVVVHSGIALDDIRRTPRLVVRQRLGLDPDVRIAANVAALVGHKDQATLLRTAARLVGRFPDLHWVIAGEGPERRALERLRDELALRERVHFLGHLPEPARLVADADVFVMSSRDEGLGTSVLDAMALGIPVASTTAGGLPEMLEGGAGVLARPGRPDELAAAVAQLVADPAFARETAARATRAVERFTAARMAEAVRGVYRSSVPFL